MLILPLFRTLIALSSKTFLTFAQQASHQRCALGYHCNDLNWLIIGNRNTLVNHWWGRQLELPSTDWNQQFGSRILAGFESGRYSTRLVWLGFLPGISVPLFDCSFTMLVSDFHIQPLQTLGSLRHTTNTIGLLEIITPLCSWSQRFNAPPKIINFALLIRP